MLCRAFKKEHYIFYDLLQKRADFRRNKVELEHVGLKPAPGNQLCVCLRGWSADRQTDRQAAVGGLNANVIQIYGGRRAWGRADTVYVIEMHTGKNVCPPQEKKMKKKGKEKQPRVFGNEGKIEFQDLPFICCSAWLLSASIYQSCTS